ncbi:hypothetical protein KLPMMM297M_26710 [Klebsiella pneumoniae]
MGTVCAQTDRHSVSCIVMQRAENVPDAFFRFTMGKTSLFAVFAAESRSARFSGARNKSLHHAPHPAVVPVPYSHRHRRAKFWRPDSKSFCRFCAAAVPRDRQTGSQGISRSAHLYKLHFVSFVVRSATLKKPRNGGNFRDRMCNCNTVTRDAITIAPGQGCAPTPRQRLTAREKIPRTAHRSRTRQTENRGAPRLWRGFRFCD